MILVQSPGLLTTVQDLGRYGYAAIGVSVSGAADPIALRLGNRLVGNTESVAGLEMTLLGGTFIFPDGGLIALTGSDFGPTLDGAAVPMWTACAVRAGQTLKLGPTRSGARCYLTVRGGIAVNPLLGSASTHILTGLGGFDGRQLRKGDQLPIGVSPQPAPDRPRQIEPTFLEKLRPRNTFRTTVGPQTDAFSPDAINAFYKSPYRVTEQSNRMGLRLEGASIHAPYSGHMLTEGVSVGAVQIPAGGQPIVLFVDQGTAGGYPKIANVISADLAGVGQLRPGDEIYFELVSPQTASALIREQERLLAELSLSLG